MTRVLKYRKLRANAMTPRRSHSSDAGLDLATCEYARLQPGRTVALETGCAFELPAGHVGIIAARSSTTLRGLAVAGVLDAGYRGGVRLLVTNQSQEWVELKEGEYIAQLLVLPCATPGLELVVELSPSDRGQKAFGSSDRKPGNGG
jgi:dUTP pyrophosphatase